MSPADRELRVSDYLDHMIEAISLARSYVAEYSKSEFQADRRTQQAVVLNLITLGEIAARLINEHPEFVTKQPNIPWRQMRGMRNRMAHGYFDIDLDIVWDTIGTSLPSLQATLETARAELSQES